MMDQHPIPQQISSYEFKLVGEMTIKQFLKLAGGIVMALLINSTKLIFFIKYPLIFGFGLGGFMMAFMPYEDRPIETWIVAFIKSIYAPTIYTYKKKAKVNWLEIDMSKVTKMEEQEEKEKEIELMKKPEIKVKEFIDSLPSVNREEKEVKEVKEENVTKQTFGAEVKENRPAYTKATAGEEDWRSKSANLNLKRERLEATGEANYGSIPMPDIPDLPNLVVGMVTDNGGKIVEGAIVEIQDENGNPARVLKTNSLGQFRVSTQMANGRYLMITEKSGFKFDRVNLDLKGEIVKPIRITATEAE